jgi:hypothetical protein
VIGFIKVFNGFYHFVFVGDGHIGSVEACSDLVVPP